MKRRLLDLLHEVRIDLARRRFLARTTSANLDRFVGLLRSRYPEQIKRMELRKQLVSNGQRVATRAGVTQAHAGSPDLSIKA